MLISGNDGQNHYFHVRNTVVIVIFKLDLEIKVIKQWLTLKASKWDADKCSLGQHLLRF